MSSEKQKRQICYEYLSFLFLTAHFEFGVQIFGGSRNISCEHPQFLVEFFDKLKIDFFVGSIGSTLRGGSNRYSLDLSRPLRSCRADGGPNIYLI